MAAGQRMNDGPKTYDHPNIPKAARLALKDVLPPKNLDLTSREGRSWQVRNQEKLEAFRRNIGSS